jgi:hypothetical protein
VYSPSVSVPPLSLLTSYTPIKSNLYFDSSFDTVIRDSALYKLRLQRESVQVRGLFRNFVTGLMYFYGEELLVSSLTPKLEHHPLSFLLSCLYSLFAATLHICRPGDAPCCGDRDSHNMGSACLPTNFVLIYICTHNIYIPTSTEPFIQPFSLP